MRASILNTANNTPLSSATPTVLDMVHCARFGAASKWWLLCQVIFPMPRVALSVLSAENVFSDDFLECFCLCLRLCLKGLLERNLYLSACLFFCCCGGVFDVPCLRSILIYLSWFVCNGVFVRQSDGIMA